MATEGLKIQVSADVQQAVSSLQSLRTQLTTLSPAASQAFSALGKAAAVTGGITAAAVALKLLQPFLKEAAERFQVLGDRIRDQINSFGKFKDAIDKFTPTVTSSVGPVIAYVKALESGALTTKQAAIAQQELIKAAPVFKDAFDKNGVAVKNLSDVLTNEYIPSLINTIRFNAATTILNKRLEESFNTLASGGRLTGLEKLRRGLTDLFGPLPIFDDIADFQSQEQKLRAAQNRLKGPSIAADFKQIFETLGLSNEEIGKFLENLKLKQGSLKGSKESLEKIVISLQAAKGITAGLSDIIKEQNAKYREQIEILNEINALNAVPVDRERARGGTTADLANLADLAGGPTAIEQLQAVAGEFQALNKDALALADTINDGISAGIDTFFFALANNQDPFKALALSAKRLVAELAAAVVKAFILKQIANTIAPGSGFAIDAVRGTGGAIARGDLLQLVALGRGGR